METIHEPVIVDVREKEEFDGERIEGSVSVPLSRFCQAGPGVFRLLQGKPVLLMCRGGTRAALAERQLAELGFADKVSAKVFAGGLLEWKKQGRPVVKSGKNTLPILRQVQLMAGLLILATTLIGILVYPPVTWMAALFGAGIMVAGLTGYCGLAEFLALMPWNRSQKM